ncbi:MAG: winged helix-turn-helix domain-containing protein [Thermoanaerobaculia bacterium]
MTYRAGKPRPAPVVRPRIRVTQGSEIVVGPGKADLLDAVQATGSLRKAAAALRMSYMRAWQLVQTMNRAFRDPVVILVRGGAAHGGAALTPAGKRVLALYRAMERKCARAATADARALGRLLRT